MALRADPSYTTERGWAVGRIAISAAGAALAPFSYAGSPSALIAVCTAAALMFLAGVLTVVLLRKGHIETAFLLGFVADNTAFLIGAFGVVLLGPAPGDTDFYLIMLPLMMIGAAHAGLVLGLVQAALWLSTLAVLTILTQPSTAYSVQQMPVRIFLLGLSSVMTIYVVSRLREEHRRSEERERQLAESLARLHQAEDTLVQGERLRALGQMASGIVHDMKNALSPVIGFAEMLSLRGDQLTAAERADFAQRILKSGENTLDVLSRLQDFYRPRSVDESLVPTDLSTEVAEVIKLTQPRWANERKKGGRIACVAEPAPLPPVPVNPADLRSALTNLIFNAVDAMPAGGRITLRTRVDGPYAAIDVEDTGLGMSRETLARCLEPFFTTKGKEGSGLGIPMVYGFVTRHHGRLVIRSGPGRGTCVSLLLPISGAEPEDQKGQPSVVMEPMTAPEHARATA